jgi:hemolysin III
MIWRQQNRETMPVVSCQAGRDILPLHDATVMTSELRPADEIPNLITHGLGLALSVAATLLLMPIVMAGQDLRTILACGVYCLTLILLYAASTLSHTFHDLDLRRLFRMLDQACIFLLIAGSMTPFAVVFLNQGRWWLFLPVMWGLAGAGVLFVWYRRNLTGLGKVAYGILGWLPVVAIRELSHHAPFGLLLWIVAGGVLYSVGTIFLAFDRKVRYFHALWHMFVVAGSICHYVGVLVYIALR